MNNLVEFYKTLYEIPQVNIKNSYGNSIIFIFFDKYGKYYSLKHNNLVYYSSELRLNIIDILKNIERIYKIKIIGFFPVCFTQNNSVVISCKINNSSNYLYDYDFDDKNIDKIIEISNKRLKYYSDNYNDEMILMEQYKKRYEFYQKYIKKYFLTEEKRKKKKFLTLINTLITDEINSIIDVSCGDNNDIFELTRKVKLVVGNDINCYYFSNAQSKYKNVIFTNDNLHSLEYKKNVFDVAYCKNTLHHMKDNEEIKSLLTNLSHISKKIILVEIENPMKGKFLPRLLNKYLYTMYLKDAGKNYLEFNEFKKNIDGIFESEFNISYLSFENMLGNYMIAVIEKR